MRNNNENKAWTAEELQLHIDRGYGVLMQHGEHFLVSNLVWKKDEGQVSDAKVYRLAEEPIPGFGADARGAFECKLGLVAEAEQGFQDAGHAIAWCLTQI